MNEQLRHKLLYARANGGARLTPDEAEEIMAELEAREPAQPLKAILTRATKHVATPARTKRIGRRQ